MGSRRTALRACGALLLSASLFSFCRWRRRLARGRQSMSGSVSSSEDDVVQGILPVAVLKNRLPAGWQVAPPIFLPPWMVVVPFLPPTGPSMEEVVHVTRSATGGENQTDVFLLCEGPLYDTVPMEPPHTALRRYLAQRDFLGAASKDSEVLLEEVASLDGGVEGLTDVACASPFTHLARTPLGTLLLGIHGPYVTVFVAMGLPDTVCKTAPDAAVQGLRPGSSSLQETLRLAMTAVHSLPLLASPYGAPHPPGAPPGVQEGVLRVVFPFEGMRVILTLPSGWMARRPIPVDSEGGLPPAEADDPILLLESHASAHHPPVVFPVTADRLRVLVASDGDLSSWATTEAEATAVARFTAQVTATESGVTPGMSAMYVHARLGVVFAVRMDTGVVQEPVLTDCPRLVYEPFGGCPAGSNARGVPRVELRSLTELPETWELEGEDEERLIHNVRLHFTDWEREHCDIALAEMGKFKSVVFSQAQENLRCRTCVIPRRTDLLVLRWEAPIEVWDAYLPALHLFMDTLHIDER